MSLGPPSSLPVLGVGLAYRDGFRSDLFLHREEVDFLEITADHFLDAPPEKLGELDLLARHFTLVPHALDLSLGSAGGLDPGYVEKLRSLVRRIDPPWWSEHVAFTRAGGIEIGHLAPLPFTEEAIVAFCRNTATARARITPPLVLENITYLVTHPWSEMGEGEFLTRILDRTGCGLLLDVTNLHVNAANHGFDAGAMLEELPLDRVVQLHFAGGFEEGGLHIDSHSAPAPPGVWSLMEQVLARAPVRAIVLERDENLPPFEELAAELRRARELGRKHGRWD
jgi:uncharacterized protein (UPF0276 family)